jgi:hypothetical protein
MRIRAIWGLVLAAVVLVAGMSAAAPAATSTAQINVTVNYTINFGGTLSLYRADDRETPVATSPVWSGHGTFVVEWEGLEPGKYKISSNVNAWVGGASFDSARVFDIRPGTTALTVDSVDSTTLDSEIVNANERGVPYVRVVLFGKDDPTEVIARFTSDGPDGRVLGSMGKGSKALLIDATGRYELSWAKGKASHRTAIDLPGRNEANSSIHLKRKTPLEPVPWDRPRNASISGTVRAPGYAYGEVHFRLYPADDFTSPEVREIVYRGDEPDEDLGTYSADELRPGAYKVQLTDGLWYGGDTHATAKTITVAPGHNTAHFEIPARGDIVGGVVSKRGAPLAEQLVTVYDPRSWDPIAYTLTDIHGRYEFTGMPLRGLQIRVSDAENRYLWRWYGGAGGKGDAATILPTRGRGADAGTLTLPDGLYPHRAPTMSGSRKRGSTLTAHNGGWSQSGLRWGRQWFRDDVPIRGATGLTYKLTAADVGKSVSFELTAKKQGYPWAKARSAGTVRIK